jgi:hypothetical protein
MVAMGSVANDHNGMLRLGREYRRDYCCFMERTNLHLSEGYVIARGFLEKSSGESQEQIICGGIERPGRGPVGVGR